MLETPKEGAAAQDDAAISPASARSSNQVENLYRWIRAAILNGRMAAGEKINQARLAAQLGVSRTPLREALRMLQAEGLVVGALNQRMHVARIDPQDVDSLYATRILLECFSLAVTLPRLTGPERAEIEQALAQMNAHSWTGDRQAWEVHHGQFHRMLVMHAEDVAGPVLTEMIAGFQLRAERYRRIYVSGNPQAAAAAGRDHARIVRAIKAGAVRDAVTCLAEHYGRTARVALKTLAQDFEPRCIGNALAVVADGGLETGHPSVLLSLATVAGGTGAGGGADEDGR